MSDESQGDAARAADRLSPPEPQRQVLRTWATIAIALLVLLYTIYLTRTVLLPISLALILNLVFKPVVLRLSGWGIPEAAGAAVVMLALSGAGAVLVVVLWTPASSWVVNAPENLRTIQRKLSPIIEPLRRLGTATEQVDQIASIDEDEEEPVRVQIEQPTWSSRTFLLNASTGLLAGASIVVVLLYFLLAVGDRFLEKLVTLMPTFEDKRRVVELVRDVQTSISGYLFTITMINLGLGVAIGTSMAILGLPNPALWGVMGFLLNYIPFLGATVGALLVFLVALLQFSLSYALLAPVAYVTVNMIEANFITPGLLGRSTKINPVLIILSLTLWGWMWGIGGVFLAVPFLVILKITCEHIESLEPIAEFLDY